MQSQSTSVDFKDFVKPTINRVEKVYKQASTILCKG